MSNHLSFTNEGHNAEGIAEVINAVAVANPEATVNGEAVFTRWGKPAMAYQNSTIAVSVPARTVKGRSNVRYFKLGQRVEIAY